MTTSKPSQAELFEIGFETRRELTLLPTPKVTEIIRQAESYNEKGRAFTSSGSDFGMSLSDVIARGLDSSPAVIPANPSHSPGSAWARRMTGISGRSLRRWLPTSSLGAVFSRMFLDTSRWGSTRCWLTWKRSVTPAGRSLFRLRPSAPRTGEIASGFWPTPTSSESTGPGHAAQGGMNLRTVVAMWSTPTAQLAKHGSASPAEMVRVSSLTAEVARAAMAMLPTPRHEGFDAGGHRGTTDSLHSHVKMFPTPRAIYGEHPGMSDPSHLTGAVGASQTTGKLSAAWVSRLMGYPDGWLDLEP